jgi:UDP-N-acetylmuramate--alanine ligase
VYIDDYAHHPSELAAGISSIREMYPQRKITGIFQPHLYSRTRDFADEFAAVLSTLDEVILLDIYPARELPVEGVDSQMILDKITITAKQLCHKEDLVALLNEKQGLEVVVTFGAGDIDALVPAIRQVFKTRKL